MLGRSIISGTGWTSCGSTVALLEVGSAVVGSGSGMAIVLSNNSGIRFSSPDSAHGSTCEPPGPRRSMVKSKTMMSTRTAAAAP
ncbi:MAG: hypothetical protein DWC11_00645 [Candidatus Poseidoniales archaeon]|nr:MAG: hypothetical protein DWC11_00645 [Candidatus Poseidoniales archaeon]